MNRTALLQELRNLKVCPDCHYIQRKKKKMGDKCENGNCESKVVLYHTKLTWHNENWG